MDPLAQFETWIADAGRADIRVPHAATLSTLGLDGYPNARNVAIQAVTAGGVIVTGPTASLKGRELAANPRVALTTWWDPLGRQVRIQGDATVLDRDSARTIFDARSRSARTVAVLSNQGEPRIADALETAYAEASAGPDLATMPDGWGGWVIAPLRIEFMEFGSDRFHRRDLYERDGDGWVHTSLQP
jgi:pyridoxamine 5'-phosphate oxidase